MDARCYASSRGCFNPLSISCEALLRSFSWAQARAACASFAELQRRNGHCIGEPAAFKVEKTVGAEVVHMSAAISSSCFPVVRGANNPISTITTAMEAATIANMGAEPNLLSTGNRINGIAALDNLLRP